MTSLIDNTIDGLIRRVREKTAVSDIVFMTAYPPRNLPNPIKKYVAVVENKGVATSQEFIGEAIGASRRGRLCRVDLVIRVYAPRDTAAAALVRMTSLLYDALDACNDDGMIETLSLGEIVNEKAARTVFRDVRVGLICGEESA